MLKYCLYYFVVAPGARRDPSRSQSQTNTQRHSLLSTHKDAERMCPHSFLCLISQTCFSYFSGPCLTWVWTHSRTEPEAAGHKLALSHLSKKGGWY